jgi:hypothetical protein
MHILTLEPQTAVAMGTECFIITHKFAASIATTMRTFEPLQFAIVVFALAQEPRDT